MSPRREVLLIVQDGFPRVSGDEPQRRYVFKRLELFSPRERG